MTAMLGWWTFGPHALFAACEPSVMMCIRCRAGLRANRESRCAPISACNMPKMGFIMPEMGIMKTRRARRKSAVRESRSVGLAHALFTRTQQRVLGFLFGQPERSFFATELIALTGSGSGAVQRELKRLVASGLVTVVRIGNQKHYQANPASPVFEELRSLVVKTVGLADPIRQALVPLSHRIDHALIYGSVARGSDTAESDIDLLVVADELTLEELYKALATAESALDRKINPTLYTSREFLERRSGGHPFLTRVLERDSIVLLGDPHDASATR